MASGMRRGALVLPLLALLLLPPGALASEGSFPPGTHQVPDALVVGPEDTLILGPGVSLLGAGSLEVQGRLEMRGEPGRPVQVALPIRLRGEHAHVIQHARLWGVNGTAVALENGTLRLDDVLFESSQTGLAASGPVLAHGANVTFRAHPLAGLSVGRDAMADLRGVVLEDNGAGARALPGGGLRLADVRAFGNGVHVRADVSGGGAAGPRVELRDADLGPVGPGGAAGLRLAAADDAASAGAGPALLFARGRVHDAPVGIEATGLAFRLENVTVERNEVGLSLTRAVATLRDSRLANARDMDRDPDSQVVVEDVSFAVPAATPPPADAWPAWVPWLAMAGVLVLAAAILWTARPRAAPPAPPTPPKAPVPRAPAPRPSHPGVAPPHDGHDDAPPADAPDAPAAPPALGAQERRILADILAHPDTAQAAVGERLGLSRQAVHYHVKKLEAKGLIRKTTRGRETECRAEPGAAAALERAPAAEP